MTGTDGEPTLGEVARAIAQLREDFRGEFAGISQRLDKFVLAEVYAADRRAADDRLHEMNRHIEDLRVDRRADLKSAEETRRADLKTLDEARRIDEARAAALRRWVIGSILIPLGIVLLPYLLAHQK